MERLNKSETDSSSDPSESSAFKKYYNLYNVMCNQSSLELK